MRSPLTGSVLARSPFWKFSPYALNGVSPMFLADFKNNVFSVGGVRTYWEKMVTSSLTTPQTVVDSDGVLKWAPHNYLKYSDDLSKTAWGKYLVSISSEMITTSGPASALYQTVSVSAGDKFTFTFEAKLGTMGDVKYSVFDNTNGVNIIPPTSYFSLLSSEYSNIYTSFTVPSGCTSINVYIVRDSGATGTVYAKKVILYRSDLGGMQNATDGTSYVPTGASTVYFPGIDWTDSANPGPQVWEGRTNLFLNSGSPATQGITVDAVEHTLSFIGTGSITLSGVATGSLTGTGSADADRVQLQFTPTAGTLTLTISGTVDKVQVEQGGAASPYTPTTSAAVTRSAGGFTAVQDGSLPFTGYDMAEGSMIIDGNASVLGGNLFSLSDGSAANRIYSLASSVDHLDVVTSSASQAAIDAGAFVAGTVGKLATAWSANDFSASLDGGSAVTDSAGTVPSVSELNIGSQYDGAGGFTNGTISYVAYYHKRLPDSTLVTESGT